MKNCLLSQGLILGIIILFIGASVIPSTIGIIAKKTTFSGSKSSGYIQGLIDHASDGDTIYIPSGIYFENIVINKSISLIGEDKDTTIIDGGGNGVVTYISADWVNFSRFTVRNGDTYPETGPSGIEIDSKYNNISNNNIIFNHKFGIGISHQCCNIIMNNTIIMNDNYGIFMIGAYRNTIKCNVISNNGGGIYDSSGSGNLITGNTFLDDGIYLVDSFDISNDKIIDNSFYNAGLFLGWPYSFHRIVDGNTVNGKPLVYLQDESDKIITNAGQVILARCFNITVETLDLSNTSVGIELCKTYNCTLRKNICSNNFYYGIYLRDSKNNNISDNYISSNKWDGINLYNSRYNNISYNHIISNDNKGIKLYDSNNNILKSNKINLNRFGILPIESNNNTILKNNFHNNKLQASFNNCTNTWENNYWDRPRILPKIIFGTRSLGNFIIPFPWFNIDWSPAQKPYDIS